MWHASPNVLGHHLGAPSPGHCGVQTPQQRQLDPFEAISLGPAAPGQPEAANPLEFPRPAGPDASAADDFPEPAHPRNCSARFMRLTVNAIPAQQVHNEMSWHVGQAPRRVAAQGGHAERRLAGGRPAAWTSPASVGIGARSQASVLVDWQGCHQTWRMSACLGRVPCSMQSSAGADMLCNPDVTGHSDHDRVARSPCRGRSWSGWVQYLHG